MTKNKEKEKKRVFHSDAMSSRHFATRAVFGLMGMQMPFGERKDQSSRLSPHTNHLSGAPNEKNIEKRFKCSFLLSHIVLWSFKGIFVGANKN